MYVTNVYNTIKDLRTVAPTVQANGINFDPDTGVLSFTRGNGEKALVLLSRKVITKLPFDQLTYPVNSYICDARVIYRGVEDEINIASFLSLGTWHIRIFEFNGVASVEKYLRSTGVDNPIEFDLAEGAGIFDVTFDDSFE